MKGMMTLGPETTTNEVKCQLFRQLSKQFLGLSPVDDEVETLKDLFFKKLLIEYASSERSRGNALHAEALFSNNLYRKGYHDLAWIVQRYSKNEVVQLARQIFSSANTCQSCLDVPLNTTPIEEE